MLQQSPKSADEDQRFSPEGHLGTSSRLRYRSGEGTLHWSCLSLCHGPPVAAAPQQASPEPLGSQEPPALSRKVPLLVMTLEAAAHSKVPADRRVDGQCSCVRCDGYEPSII
jgi:hypothetical protein